MTTDAGALWLSDLRGLPVVAADAHVSGRVIDLAIGRWNDHPRVTHVVFGRRRRPPQYVMWSDVAAFEAQRVRLRPDAQVEPAPPPSPALLLCRDVLDAQVVDVAGKRVRRISDVCLQRSGNDVRVAGVDTGWRAIVRRLGLPAGSADGAATVIDWADVHLASSRHQELQLETGTAALHRLSPTELSELVAQLPVEHGAGVLEAVDRTRAAGALSTARPLLGGQLFEALEPAAAGEILSEMPIDDAVAALRHVTGPRGAELLRQIPTARAAELRRLLELPAHTAGGLMTPDIRTASVAEQPDAIQRRLADDPPRLEGLTTVFVVDEAGRLAGALPPSALLAGAEPRAVRALALDTPIEEVIDAFALDDALALPVVDADGRPVGAVAIDDVLEELLVERLPHHRRRYRRARVRERAAR